MTGCMCVCVFVCLFVFTFYLSLPHPVLCVVIGVCGSLPEDNGLSYSYSFSNNPLPLGFGELWVRINT